MGNNAIAHVRGALEKMKPQIGLALPPGIDADRFNRIAMTAIQQNSYLLKCDRTTLFGSIVSAAQLGLELDPFLGQAYLVPMKRKVQMIPGYRGLIHLARQSGEVKNIKAVAVREKDEFTYEQGSDPKLVHKPPMFTEERGEIVGFYAIVWYENGVWDFEPMSRDDVDRIRDLSEAYRAYKDGKIKSTPWVSHYEEMGCKTAIRKLAKRMPLSPKTKKFHQAVAMDEAHDLGKVTTVDPDSEQVIDVEAYDAPEPESQEAEEGGDGMSEGDTSDLDDIAGEKAAEADEAATLTRDEIAKLYQEAKKVGARTKQEARERIIEAADGLDPEDVLRSEFANVRETLRERGEN